MNGYIDQIMAVMLGVLVLLFAGLVTGFAVSGYQSYRDSQVCKARTGFYSCDLKEQEQTHHIKLEKK